MKRFTEGFAALFGHSVWLSSDQKLHTSSITNAGRYTYTRDALPTCESIRQAVLKIRARNNCVRHKHSHPAVLDEWRTHASGNTELKDAQIRHMTRYETERRVRVGLHLRSHKLCADCRRVMPHPTLRVRHLFLIFISIPSEVKHATSRPVEEEVFRARNCRAEIDTPVRPFKSAASCMEDRGRESGPSVCRTS